MKPSQDDTHNLMAPVKILKKSQKTKYLTNCLSPEIVICKS